MNPKPRPHHKMYLQILRKMTPEQRLMKAFELSDLSRHLFAQGLQKLHPNLSPEEFRQLYLSRLELCHNRNY